MKVMPASNVGPVHCITQWLLLKQHSTCITTLLQLFILLHCNVPDGHSFQYTLQTRHNVAIAVRPVPVKVTQRRKIESTPVDQWIAN